MATRAAFTQPILLITDKSPWSRMARDVLQRLELDFTHLAWERGNSSPEQSVVEWKGDWIFAFKADYIVPADQLSRALKGAINFHPGPPSIRGIGAYEVAVDQKRTTFGVTCHHMAGRVDAGPIIKVRRFRIDGTVDAKELREIASAELLALFLQIVQIALNGDILPVSKNHWSGPLHTWKEFDRRAEI